jgi:flagellar biosynthesis/type III secretory pathway chaperone
VSVEELSLVLWRERELLEMLLFKLEEEQLVLESGRTRWLAHAAREVETVLETIRQTEVLRATTADAVAASSGMRSNPSLLALAEAIDEPWKSIMLDHREAFVRATEQIMSMATTNRELLTAGYQAARDTLLSISDGSDTYGADGTTVAAERRPRLLDRSI